MNDRQRPEDLERFARLCAFKRQQHASMVCLLVEDVESMLAELRERRAADLTADDIDGLKWARHCLGKDPHLDLERSAKAYAILDRLLARAVR